MDKNSYLIFGIAAHAGLQIEINKNWGITVQTNPTLNAYKHLKRTISDEDQASIDNSILTTSMLENTGHFTQTTQILT